MKNFILVVSILVCLYSCSKSSGDFVGKGNPNFVIFLIDDLGETDIGVYGNDFIETPHIDQLAQDGMRWINAYASAPVCSPTRAALLTGKNPAKINFTGHIPAVIDHRYPPHGRIIPPKNLMHIPKEEVILPEALKPAGYISISIGKWHVGHKGYWPTDMGFDKNIAGWTHGSPPSHFFPYKNPVQSWNPSIPTLNGGTAGEYLTDRLTEEAITFIKSNYQTPFLLYLSHYAVHMPLQAPENLVEKYRQKKITQGNESIDPVYAAMVERVDYGIGRVLDAIKEVGIEANTVIIFASDNGAVAHTSDMGPYRGGKGYLYEGGLRVPFMMKWPGHIQPGSKSFKPTKTEDIYRTIMDIAGESARPGNDLDGRSLVSDFDGMGDQPTEKYDMHWYFPHYIRNQPGAAIISNGFKLIEFYDPERTELYHLIEDRGETVDLSDSLAWRWKLKELQGKHRKWLHDVHPILHTTNPDYIPGGDTQENR